ncbi:unnamed protein product, partial [Allacma fusca]
MIVPFLLLFISIFLLFLSLRNPGEKNEFFRKIPGPNQWPIIGSVLDVNIPLEKYYQWAISLHKRFGNRCVLRTFGMNFVILSDPDDIEKLLTSSSHIQKGTTYKFLLPWLGTGLITSQGQKWQKRRKMLTSAFHFRILEDFLVIFDEHANIFVDVLRKDFSDGKERNISPYISCLGIDIIGETAMGKSFNSQRTKDTSYLQAVEKACEVAMYRAFRPHFWLDTIFNITPYGQLYKANLKTLHDFTDQVIEARKETKGKRLVRKLSRTNSEEVYWHGRRRMAFLDLLLEAQKNPENELTDADIREEVDTFMFAGQDTSATCMSWTIFLLGLYPHCQEKVLDEMDAIFGEDRTRPTTSKDLAEMKYLEMCIKESLRLFPIVAGFTRRTTTDLALDDEVTIPPGTDVAVAPLMVHRNEILYPEPEKYDPDRFLPENTRNRHPLAYIPFSAGQRNCIGQKFAMMEMKVILSNLFRHFKVEAAERIEDMTILIEVTMKPKDGHKRCLSIPIRYSPVSFTTAIRRKVANLAPHNKEWKDYPIKIWQKCFSYDSAKSCVQILQDKSDLDSLSCGTILSPVKASTSKSAHLFTTALETTPEVGSTSEWIKKIEDRNTKFYKIVLTKLTAIEKDIAEIKRFQLSAECYSDL